MIVGGDARCRRRCYYRSSTWTVDLQLLMLCLAMVVMFLPSTRIADAFTAIPTMTIERTSLASVVELSHLEYCNDSGQRGNNNNADGARTTTVAKSRPPVIFLHGLLGNKRNFSSIARSLYGRLKHPRRILGLDLRNHGDNCASSSSSTTSAHRHDMSYTSMAMDVLHFMDANDMPTVELIGHSVGGKVAQYVQKIINNNGDGKCFGVFLRAWLKEIVYLPLFFLARLLLLQQQQHH
jgi:predicted alpha/beta-fold hydrolase